LKTKISIQDIRIFNVNSSSGYNLFIQDQDVIVDGKVLSGFIANLNSYSREVIVRLLIAKEIDENAKTLPQTG
jgi:hypothetical protein